MSIGSRLCQMMTEPQTHFHEPLNLTFALLPTWPVAQKSRAGALDRNSIAVFQQGLDSSANRHSRSICVRGVDVVGSGEALRCGKLDSLGTIVRAKHRSLQETVEALEGPGRLDAESRKTKL